MLDFDKFPRRSIHPMQTLRILCLVMLLGTASAASDAKSGKPNPLFADDEILEVTITAPFSTIMSERPTEEEVPGQLSYVDPEAGEVVFDVGIRTRGRYRQRISICPFAPLRLNFRKEQTKKTLFRKTDKVKLVTHCKDGSERYSQGVLREYLAYRILNTLTEMSFKVRLLRTTYVDTSSDRADRVNFAFLIEEDDRLAKRLDMEVSDQQRARTSALDGGHTNVGSVFQYLIGNTDFSPIMGAPEEPCCHNYILLRPEEGNEGKLLSVPYDFDMSGLVNAKHAKANPRFQLRTVRVRLYRGRCANNTHLEDSLQAFRDRRQEIDALVSSSPHMSDPTKEFLLKYINDFYKTINNPKAVESRLRKKCI